MAIYSINTSFSLKIGITIIHQFTRFFWGLNKLQYIKVPRTILHTQQMVNKYSGSKPLISSSVKWVVEWTRCSLGLLRQKILRPINTLIRHLEFFWGDSRKQRRIEGMYYTTTTHFNLYNQYTTGPRMMFCFIIILMQCHKNLTPVYINWPISVIFNRFHLRAHIN